MPFHYTYSEAEIGEDLFYNYRLEVEKTKDIKVRNTGSKGLGLFSRHVIAEGAFIAEYWGDIINRETKNKRVQLLKDNNIRAAYFARLGGGLYVDATDSACVTKRCNHSCSPNCKLYRVKVYGANGGFVRMIGLYALREIEKGEELTYDYGPPGSDPFQHEVCRCGSLNCRGCM